MEKKREIIMAIAMLILTSCAAQKQTISQTDTVAAYVLINVTGSQYGALTAQWHNGWVVRVNGKVAGAYTARRYGTPFINVIQTVVK